jgi:hypothetical protein
MVEPEPPDSFASRIIAAIVIVGVVAIALVVIGAIVFTVACNNGTGVSCGG